MKIKSFVNYGPWGTYEEGLLLETKDDVYVVHESGVFPVKDEGQFNNQKEVDDFLVGVIDVFSNRIAGDKEIQNKLLRLIDPETIKSFIEKNKVTFSTLLAK